MCTLNWTDLNWIDHKIKFFTLIFIEVLLDFLYVIFDECFKIVLFSIFIGVFLLGFYRRFLLVSLCQFCEMCTVSLRCLLLFACIFFIQNPWRLKDSLTSSTSIFLNILTLAWAWRKRRSVEKIPEP